MMGEVEGRGGLLAQAAAARDADNLHLAEALYLAAAGLDRADPEPHHHLGVLYERRGQLGAAEAAFRRALELAPQAAGTRRLLAVLLLSQGRFDEGFSEYEARFEGTGLVKPALPYPEWRGEPVAGKRILVWPEQGFGDQIQFARFAPVLRERGADVTLLCAPPLARLFAGSLGVEVLPAAGEVRFGDPDAWVMACSTAWRLGVAVGTIPAAPYLTAVSAWPAIPGALKVGLATRGNPNNLGDAGRSLSEAEAGMLRELGAAIVDLDPAATGAKDFADTAAIIDQLDLVIAVDTAVAHLAGAMGKPVWVLLPARRTDWRWMRGRSDSPWYPTMRLYRQDRAGDWSGPLARVREDFKTFR